MQILNTPEEIRKAREIEHGRNIASHAAHVWNRTSKAGQRRMTERFADLRQFFGDRPGPLLEIGAGTGTWTELLATGSWGITALELSGDLLDRAKLKPFADRVTWVQHDAENLPFEENHFDFVCGLSILHHLHLERSLKEIFRVLKPGGKLWFSEPNMLNPQIFIQKNVPIIKKWAGDTPDETAFFRWPLFKKIHQAGFIHILVKPFDFLHPSLPDFAVQGVYHLGQLLEKTPGVREIAGSLLIHATKPPLPQNSN